MINYGKSSVRKTKTVKEEVEVEVDGIDGKMFNFRVEPSYSLHLFT